MSYMYRAVLFDMNGVIVDDEALHEAAFREVLHRKGFQLSHRDYLDCFAGRTDRNGFESFLSRSENAFDLKQLLKEKSEAYQSLAIGNLRPYPEVVEFIRKLADRSIPLALVTSATESEAHTVLETFGLKSHFPVIVTARDITEGKPSPEGYLLAAKNLNTPAEQCIVIEDAPSGIRAAKSAGMHCVAVTHTHDASELSQGDIVFPGFDESLSRHLLELLTH